MRVYPEYDFPLSARRESRDQIQEVAAFYEGILAVTLNVVVEVLFVPETPRAGRPWPPPVPENIDLLRTPEEARRVSLALSDYVVTPDPARAGGEEVLFYPGDGLPEETSERPPWQSVVFYTTLAEYAALADEVLALSRRAPNFRHGLPASELAGSALLGFLLRRVITSPHFAPEHRRLLGR